MFSAAGNKSGVNLERKNHFLRCDNISRNSLSGEIKNSWTKESNKSLSHFVDLRRGGHFTDVTLDIFGTQIKAHKVKYLSSLVGIVSQVLPTDRVICQQSIFLHAVLLPPEWEVRRDSVLWRGVSGRDEVGTSTSQPHPQYNPGWSWPRLLWACWWSTSTLGRSGWTPTSAPWWTSPSPRTVSSSRRAATCCQPRLMFPAGDCWLGLRDHHRQCEWHCDGGPGLWQDGEDESDHTPPVTRGHGVASDQVRRLLWLCDH